MARKKLEASVSENGDNSSSEELFEHFKKELNSGEINDAEQFISTGSTILDYCIANKPNGGVPMHRVIEICGAEASGKSLIAYHIIANTQKKGGIAVYIDTERAGNKEFMERMGIDWSRLIYNRKLTSIEDVFSYIEKVIQTARLKIPDKDKPVTIVWDSVAATPAKAVLEREYDQANMGTEARAMSQAFKKIMEALDEGGVTLVCINQLRQKIGVMFGDPDVTPHGKALAFYASLRIKMGGTQKIKDKNTDRVVGISATAKVFKNKVAPNWREAHFPLYYDWGVNDEESVLDFLSDSGFIKSGGAWKTIEVNGQTHKFQSPQWKELMSNKDFRQGVMKEVENRMIINFTRDMDTVKIDTDSLMEVEQLREDIKQNGAL